MQDITTSAPTPVKVLYENEFTGKADVEGWVYKGASDHKPMPAFSYGSLKVRNRGHSDLAVPADLSQFESVHVEAVIGASALEAGDECRLEVSFNGFATQSSTSTVVAVSAINEDRQVSGFGNYIAQFEPVWQSIDVRLVADVDAEDDVCFVHSLTVTAVEAADDRRALADERRPPPAMKKPQPPPLPAAADDADDQSNDDDEQQQTNGDANNASGKSIDGEDASWWRSPSTAQIAVVPVVAVAAVAAVVMSRRRRRQVDQSGFDSVTVRTE